VTRDYDAWKLRSDRDDWSEKNHEPPKKRDDFSVVQVFEDKAHEWVRRHVDADEAFSAARHYTTSLGAKLGVVESVLIVNRSDECCFLWIKGKGIVFPRANLTPP
jgi:hypothetical protein